VRTRYQTIVFAILTVIFAGQSAAADNSTYTLPAPVALELRHLEETYRVLDQVADQVWRGWKNYRDFPFSFHFDNGLVVLVGHPNPPEGYELLPNVTVAGKTVHVDTRTLDSLELKSPLAGGGGIIPLGATADGKGVRAVSMKLSNSTKTTPEALKNCTDRQILIYIHELFHCFQDSMFWYVYGNLEYNPDAEYSLYSCIEGQALEKAYREPEAEKARAYAKDFIVARELKRKASMTEMQVKEESSDDLREGTSKFSEIRTLESLRRGYQPGLTDKEDPFYSGFKDVSPLIDEYLSKLAADSREVMSTRDKCYQYGSMQALLLQRFFPGWQEFAPTKKLFLDEELKIRIPVSEPERTEIAARFASIYGSDTLRIRCLKEIGERDSAVESVLARKGQIYILNFKPIQDYILGTKERKSFSLGLIEAFPEGIADLKINDIEISGISCPAEKNQLYYLKLVDTAWREGQKPFSITFESQEPDGVYRNAVVTTPLFTLKAPKIKIEESGNRVKISLLARLRES
jgi:hypothetical protein